MFLNFQPKNDLLTNVWEAVDSQSNINILLSIAFVANAVVLGKYCGAKYVQL